MFKIEMHRTTEELLVIFLYSKSALHTLDRRPITNPIANEIKKATDRLQMQKRLQIKFCWVLAHIRDEFADQTAKKTALHRAL